MVALDHLGILRYRFFRVALGLTARRRAVRRAQNIVSGILRNIDGQDLFQTIQEGAVHFEADPFFELQECLCSMVRGMARPAHLSAAPSLPQAGGHRNHARRFAGQKFAPAAALGRDSTHVRCRVRPRSTSQTCSQAAACTSIPGCS